VPALVWHISTGLTHIFSFPIGLNSDRDTFRLIIALIVLEIKGEEPCCTPPKGIASIRRYVEGIVQRELEQHFSLKDLKY
jgi:hypothetical protein